MREVELAKSFWRSLAVDLSIEIVGRNMKKCKDVEGHKKKITPRILPNISNSMFFITIIILVALSLALTLKISVRFHIG
jgi:hypothetical protein